MDSPGLSLVKSDILLKDIVEKSLFYVYANFVASIFTTICLHCIFVCLHCICKVFEKNHYNYNKQLFFLYEMSVVMIPVIQLGNGLMTYAPLFLKLS